MSKRGHIPKGISSRENWTMIKSLIQPRKKVYMMKKPQRVQLKYVPARAVRHIVRELIG